MDTIIDLGDIDLHHNAIGAVSIYSKQAGFLSVEATVRLLQAHLPAKLLPPEVGHSTALRRAVEDGAKGSKNKRVESKGKSSKAVYSIISIDREGLDLEESSGKGIADSELSARVEENGVGGESLVIHPIDHPQAQYIRERYDFHRYHFKCSEDLSKWMSQTIMTAPELQAITRPGHGGGLYYIPKGPGFDLALKIKDALEEINVYSGRTLTQGVKVYAQPVFTQFSDCVDAITDALLDDFDKACDGINSYLHSFEEGENTVRFKGLESKAKEAQNLRKKLDSFAKACGMSFDDLKPRIDAVEARIAMAEVVLAST